jgi:hypothetical protein
VTLPVSSRHLKQATFTDIKLQRSGVRSKEFNKLKSNNNEGNIKYESLFDEGKLGKIFTVFFHVSVPFCTRLFDSDSVTVPFMTHDICLHT